MVFVNKHGNGMVLVAPPITTDILAHMSSADLRAREWFREGYDVSVTSESGATMYTIEHAKHYLDETGSVREIEEKRLVHGEPSPKHGKTAFVDIIDLTPKWSDIWRTLCVALTSEDTNGRSEAREAIGRMAQAADKWNEHVRTTGDA